MFQTRKSGRPQITQIFADLTTNNVELLNHLSVRAWKSALTCEIWGMNYCF